MIGENTSKYRFSENAVKAMLDSLILQDELETKTSTLTSVQKVAMLLCCPLISFIGQDSK